MFQFLIPGQTTVRSNRRIRIAGNVVTDSGRSGIWAANVDGLTIHGNTIERSGLFASAPIFGWPPSEFPDLRQAFTQAIVVRDADNVARDDR